MIVLVCGGRDFGDLSSVQRGDRYWPERRDEYLFLTATLCRLLHPDELITDDMDTWMPRDVRIINGGARGADSAATDWAVVNWTEFKEYQADWETHGKAAGVIRNQRMLDEEAVDLVIAFPGGNGTADMVRRARAKRIPVHEVSYDVS